MTIALSCPCGKNISVKDEAAGKQVRCPACGKALRIPSEEAAENVAASSVRGKPATPARPSRARTGLIVGAVAAIVLLGAFLIIHFSASGPSANSRGHLDTADLKNISGWAWDPDHPNRPLKVEIYDGDRLLTTVIADQFRKDLQANSIGTGEHAFFYKTPASLQDGEDHVIGAIIAGTKTKLINSPRTLGGATKRKS